MYVTVHLLCFISVLLTESLWVKLNFLLKPLLLCWEWNKPINITCNISRTSLEEKIHGYRIKKNKTCWSREVTSVLAAISSLMLWSSFQWWDQNDRHDHILSRVILLSYFTSQNLEKRGKNQDLHHGTEQNVPYQTVLSKVDISNQFFQL